MKDRLVVINFVLAALIGVAVLVFLMENFTIRNEVNKLKEMVGERTSGHKADEPEIARIENELLEVKNFVKKNVSKKGETAQVLERIEKLEEKSSKTAKTLEAVTGEPLGKTPLALKGDGAFITKAEVKELLAEEIKKLKEERASRYRPRKKKKVTLDELARELELTYEQQLKLESLLKELEIKFAKIAFNIENDAQLEELKTNIRASEYSKDIKKELQKTMMTNVFKNMGEIMPIVMEQRTKTREILGDKADRLREYDIDIQSELSPLKDMFMGAFEIRAEVPEEEKSEEKK